MKEIPHTPGPWRWSVGNGYNSGVYVLRGDDEICEVFYDCDTEALPDRANAALIAAAPDLLEALRKLANEVGALKAFEADIRDFIGNSNWAVLMQRLADADEAISKASPNLPSASQEGGE